jgi:UDP-N-acetylglucosamine 2-epimerase (non-hydrolysing)
MSAAPAKLRVLSVFGTRPDTIKMAPVVHALGRHEAIDHRVCVTAQHRKMLDDLLVLFGITPDYDLDIMSEDQTLTEITTRVLTRMEGALAEAKPEVVLVHGDTTQAYRYDRLVPFLADLTRPRTLAVGERSGR